MDDLDEEVPDLIPLVDSEGIEGSAQPDGDGPVVEPPKRLEKTVPVTLITGFLGAPRIQKYYAVNSKEHMQLRCLRYFRILNFMVLCIPLIAFCATTSLQTAVCEHLQRTS